MTSYEQDISRNQTPPFIGEYQKVPNSSILSQIEFSQHYHYLCKICKTVPIINFSSKGKIKFICKCNDSPRELNIRNIYDLLFYSEEIDNEIKLLKCEHDGYFEKYTSYCKYCGNHLCLKCSNNCIKHKKEVIVFSFDKPTINKSEYINKKLNERSIIETNIITLHEQENNLNPININNDNNENEETSKEELFLENDLNFFNDNNDKIININNENEFGIDNDEFNFINLFTIIIKDYLDYPNYNHIDTISNLEKFVNLYLVDYNEIKLNYEFQEENIKDNSIYLFGEQFVNNNKENCFLIIKDKIMDLNQSIKLTDIFDNIPNNYPIKLNVQLIERKSKIMTNLSYMFYSISTITSKSNFDGYDSSNITSLSYMFCNCKFIEYLPDISKLNTKSVTDISYMFFNCSSLKELPDISKWNTENVINANNMFENCSSITSLPDISRWDARNLLDISYMFKNCMSLTSLPNISQWNIRREIIYHGILDGVESLENIPQLRFEENIAIECLNRVFIHFKCFYENFWSWALVIVGLNLLACICYGIYAIFIPLYNLFHLDKTIESINNPSEYFNLFLAINIIVLFLIRINDKYNCMNITSRNQKTFLNIILFFDFIIFIIDILNYKIINRLSGTISDYYAHIKNIFGEKIKEENLNELDYLKSNASSIFYIFVAQIILMAILCKLRNKRTNT